MHTEHPPRVLMAAIAAGVLYSEVVGKVAASSKNMLISTLYFVPLTAWYGSKTPVPRISVTRQTVSVCHRLAITYGDRVVVC